MEGRVSNVSQVSQNYQKREQDLRQRISQYKLQFYGSHSFTPFTGKRVGKILIRTILPSRPPYLPGNGVTISPNTNTDTLPVRTQRNNTKWVTMTRSRQNANWPELCGTCVSLAMKQNEGLWAHVCDRSTSLLQDVASVKTWTEWASSTCDGFIKWFWTLNGKTINLDPFTS